MDTWMSSQPRDMQVQPLVTTKMINDQHIDEIALHAFALDSSGLTGKTCPDVVDDVVGSADAVDDVACDAIVDESVAEASDAPAVEPVVPAAIVVVVVVVPSSALMTGDATLDTAMAKAEAPIVSSSWADMASVISSVSLEANKAPTSFPVAVKVTGASPGTSMAYVISTCPL